MIEELEEEGREGGGNAIFGEIIGIHLSAISLKKNATFRAILHDFMVISYVLYPLYIPYISLKYRKKKAILIFLIENL